MQVTSGRTFTNAARRAQIIEHAIAAIAELGYAGASFAQIAKRAGLSSTRLISYHFAGKDELTAEVARRVLAEFAAFVRPRVDAADGAAAQLRAFIEANIDFMGAHRTLCLALMEIAVTTRSEDRVLKHMAEIAESDLTGLEELLRRGQDDGEFRRFDPRVLAVAVLSLRNGVIRQLALDQDLDLQSYRREWVELVERATRKE